MENLVGRRFGRLIALEPAKTKNGRNGFLCQCDCGNYTIVKTANLISGDTRSCGCLFKDTMSKRNRVHGEAGGALEGKRTRLYRCWTNMKSRCYNPKVRSYADYGAKGIEICEEWYDFSKFAEWAHAHGYKDNLTIERIDPKGNYCPENCEWITAGENTKRACQRHCWGKNTKTNEYVEFWCIRDFAKERGLSYSCIDQVLHGRNKTHQDWIFGYLN